MSRVAIWRSVVWLVLLLVVAGVRWKSTLLWSQPLLDEAIYLEAVDQLLAGESPYSAPRFLYNPPFAVLLAHGVSWFGVSALMTVLRSLSLLFSVLIPWVSMRRVGFSRVVAGLTSGMIVVASPIVMNNMAYGNASLWIVGMAVVGLWLMAAPSDRDRAVGWVPLGGAVLLGVSVGLKPIAVAALPILALGGGSRGRASRRVMAASAGGVALALQYWGWQYLPGLLSRSGGLPDSGHNLSLQRIAYCFGIEVSPWVLLAATSVLGVLWTIRRSVVGWQLAAIAGVVSILALPAVWLHTMAFTYPIQAVAIARLKERSRQGSRRRWELAWVGLAVLAVHAGHGMGGLGMLPLPWQGAFLAIPVLAPLLLALYVVEWDRGVWKTGLREEPQP